MRFYTPPMGLDIMHIEEFASRLAPLEQRANAAWWAASLEVSDAHDEERIAADLALRELLGDAETFRALAK